MVNYYITTIERFHLEGDPEDSIGDNRHFFVKANDKNEAHEKIHKFLYEFCDRKEGEWYLSLEDSSKERIYSITQIITVIDLEKVLPEIN